MTSPSTGSPLVDRLIELIKTAGPSAEIAALHRSLDCEERIIFWLAYPPTRVRFDRPGRGKSWVSTMATLAACQRLRAFLGGCQRSLDRNGDTIVEHDRISLTQRG